MNPDNTVSIPARIVVRDLGSDFVLVDMSSGTYFGLNPVGARMWTLLGEGLTPRQVGEVISGEFDAPVDQVTRDLEALLASLAEQKLVMIQDC